MNQDKNQNKKQNKNKEEKFDNSYYKSLADKYIEYANLADSYFEKQNFVKALINYSKAKKYIENILRITKLPEDERIGWIDDFKNINEQSAISYLLAEHGGNKTDNEKMMRIIEAIRNEDYLKLSNMKKKNEIANLGQKVNAAYNFFKKGKIS